MITLSAETKDYRGDPLYYTVDFYIPVTESYFGKWEDQCIALNNQGAQCMSPPYKEHPLYGLCSRHWHANEEAAGGARTINYEPKNEIRPALVVAETMIDNFANTREHDYKFLVKYESGEEREINADFARGMYWATEATNHLLWMNLDEAKDTVVFRIQK